MIKRLDQRRRRRRNHQELILMRPLWYLGTESFRETGPLVDEQLLLRLPLGADVLLLLLRADRPTLTVFGRLTLGQLALLLVAVLHLVLLVRLTRGAPLEFPHAGPQRPRKLRDALSPEEHQDNDQQDDQLAPAK